MLQYVVLSILGIMIMPAFADSSMILNVNTFSEFTEGQNPVVYGNITDSDGNAISNVHIQAAFPSRTIMTNTNATGQFNLVSPTPAEPGTYTVQISATNDRVFADTQIQYTVTPKQQIEKQKTKPTNEEFQLDPFSKMLKQLEQQKYEHQKAIQESKQQKSIQQQRSQAKSNIQDDFKELQRETESHSPRNAFLGFLTDIDHTVRDIFWHQFLFTESITTEAHKAKQQALDSGKSSVESTKIFQKKAAVTKKEVIDHNKKLNLEYGNATLDNQERFNEYGKIPRD